MNKREGESGEGNSLFLLFVRTMFNLRLVDVHNLALAATRAAWPVLHQGRFWNALAKNCRIERKCGALIRATDSSARRKANETSLGKMYAPMNLEISGIREIIKDIMSSARRSSSMKATAKYRFEATSHRFVKISRTMLLSLFLQMD